MGSDNGREAIWVSRFVCSSACLGTDHPRLDRPDLEGVRHNLMSHWNRSCRLSPAGVKPRDIPVRDPAKLGEECKPRTGNWLSVIHDRNVPVLKADDPVHDIKV